MTQTAMDLPSLEYHKLRGDAIETYKYIHGKYQVDFTYCHSTNPMVLLQRGHSFKLDKRHCKLIVRENVLGCRIVNFWNSLPESVVSAESVNVFKGRFDKHCCLLRYCTGIDDLWKNQREATLRSVYRPMVYERPNLMMMMMI